MRGHWDNDAAARFLESRKPPPDVKFEPDDGTFPDHLTRSQYGMPVYRPHTNSFWYGAIAGFCLATSIAAFAAATHYLGVW